MKPEATKLLLFFFFDNLCIKIIPVMSRTRLTPRIEILIIGVFFVSFIVWAVSKCKSAKAEYQNRAALEAYEDSVALSHEKTLSPPAVQAPATAAQQVIKERTTPLYVTVEGLKLRATPDLKGKVLTQLKLYEEVVFLNEVTDSSYQIKLGTVTTTEPWVKVQGRGHVGWVYGAGVDYYKRKLEGAN